MFDDINGFYYTYNEKIDLTPSEYHVLDILIKKKFAKDNDFYDEYSSNFIRITICRLNKKLKGELEIKRKYKMGYYIKYIGRRNTNEIRENNEVKRATRIYKRKLYTMPRTM